MIKPKTIIATYGVYPFDVIVSTKPPADLARDLGRLGYDLFGQGGDLHAGGDGVMVMLKSWHAVIRLTHPPTMPQGIAVLSHEIFHAVTELFTRLGLSLTPQSEEAYAYAIQHLTEQVLTKFQPAAHRSKK